MISTTCLATWSISTTSDELFCGTKVGDEGRRGQRFKNPEVNGEAEGREAGSPRNCKTSPWQDQVQTSNILAKATMVRPLLFLALIASVIFSVNASAQVAGGGIRGSSSVGTESSTDSSSALASAAASVLKVWPHPAAQVLQHATHAVQRKLVSDTNMRRFVMILVICSVSCCVCAYLWSACEKRHNTCCFLSFI